MLPDSHCRLSRDQVIVRMLDRPFHVHEALIAEGSGLL